MVALYQCNPREHLDLFIDLAALDEPVMKAAQMVAGRLRQGGKLMLCRNGGSAADCQHIAAEFTGRVIEDRKPL